MSAEMVLVGVSHHTTPVELREQLSIESRDLAREVRRVADRTGVSEAALVSTCNRLELVGVTSDPGAAVLGVSHYLNERLAPNRADGYLYRRTGRDATHHLFRVASGLDSMVLGEPQILGQVKEAFSCAHAAGTVGALLSRCFHHAFAAAKRVRSETAIGAGHVSVSSVACDLAERIFGVLKGRRALLVGAGEMSELAARCLTSNGVELFVVNRSPERARELADNFSGTARPLEALAHELAEADVVLSSTSSRGFIITRELVQEARKKRRSRPLFVIDMAVPRDVDPVVGSIDDVFVYDIDDLRAVAASNLAERRSSVTAAERIIDAAVENFEKWRGSLRVTPTITALRAYFQSVALEEMQRTLPRLSSACDKDRQKIEAMCNAILKKLLHDPLVALKSGDGHIDEARMIEALQQLFGLEIADLPEEGGGEVFALQGLPAVAR